MEIQIAAAESAERAETALSKLKETVDAFRGSVKNDLSSMKAASERVQTEVQQMQQKYKQAQDMLTTPEFMQAIANAERMAAALTAIQALTETKISVAVFGTGKTT
jgi:cell division septum initiation protein DivIVA